MGFFFVLLLFPIMMQHITIKGYHISYKKRNKNALTFFFVLLTFLVMFRHKSVGNDTSNYIYYFEQFSLADWSAIRNSSLEIGYSFFIKVLTLLSDEPVYFLAVSGLIVTSLIYPTYKRLCVDASLTIVLYCTMSTFVMMFSGMRQMLAIGLGFIAYELTRRKNLPLYVLIVLLTVSIHTSGFMLAFMYPLYHANITKKWLYVVVPVMAVIFLFNRQIFSLLSVILARYTDYNGAVTSTGAYTMLFLFIIFTIFSFAVPDPAKLDQEIIGMRNFLLLSVMLQMFAPLHSLAMRMNYYYIIFIPLLLPKIIACKSRRWRQVAIMGRHVMLLFFLLYFFMNASRGGGLNVFPYHFFWENV